MGVRLLRVDEIMAEILKLRAAGVEVVIEEKPESTAGVAAEEPSETKEAIFPITFDTPHDLATSYKRDIKYGGLFIASPEPAEQDEQVVLEFRFAWDRAHIVRVQAQVVKKFAAAEGSVVGETVSGMGVAFSNPADVLTQFKSVLSALEQAPTQGEEGA